MMLAAEAPANLRKRRMRQRFAEIHRTCRGMATDFELFRLEFGSFDDSDPLSSDASIVTAFSMLDHIAQHVLRQLDRQLAAGEEA